jgi:MoaA/NifB/PqqE/SkfB family radical SAM enzyme
LSVKARLERWARMLHTAIYAAIDRDHPILAHIIPMRRCNLSCGYCNEYDAVSKPVPLPTLQRRVDRLAALGTSIVTISGGEPLLHPELEGLVAHVRRRRMLCTLITNGYLLSRDRIRELNRAGLDHLQISIDNVEPDDISMKSLRLLEPKLGFLARDAAFSVAINSVVGGGVHHPEDALTVSRRARQLGFMTSVGVIHDGDGQLKPLPSREMAVYRELRRAEGLLGRVNGIFQDNLAEGRPSSWRCRAGARYLYVCEDGLVHYCSQQRGRPGIPLERYTLEDVRREYRTPKACAPFCTINCVQQVGLADNWRSPQRQIPPVRPSTAGVTADVAEGAAG